MEAKEDSQSGASEGERALELPPSLDSAVPKGVPRAVTPAQPVPTASKLKQVRVLFSQDGHWRKEVPEVTIETESDPPRNTTLLPANPKLSENLTEQVSGAGTSEQDGLPGKCLKTEEPNKTVTVRLTKAQREALKAERERVKMEAKAKREAEKQERRTKREQEERERKERKEKKESEKKQREEERKKKEEERRKKEEERRERRETERKLREEERRKREEEKKKKEEEKEQVREEKLRKEQLAKNRFYGYFSKVDGTQKKDEPIDQDASIVTPFPVKAGMVLARRPRSSLDPSERAKFDSFFHGQSESHRDSYISEIRGKKLVCRPRAVLASEECPSKPDSNEVMIISPVEGKDRREGQTKVPPQYDLCFKLLQFQENHRPAYYGTWQKSSGLVTARSPFRKDMCLLDYDVDSDDEWEEEEPGESISESEKEDEDSGGEEMEEDDGFFVPHGYLSAGEGEDSGEEMETTIAPSDPNARRKQKQLAKAKAWEAEFARKCQPLRTTQIGCIWPRPGSPPEGGRLSREETFLQQFAAMALVELPIRIAAKSQLHSEEPGSSARRVPEEAMPDLIRSVHGSSLGLGRLVKSFQAQWGANVSSTDTTPQRTADQPQCVATPDTPQERANFAGTFKISKRQLERKITAIAIKEPRPPNSKPLWYVHDSVMKQYGIDAGELAILVDMSNSSPPTTPCCGGGGTKKGIKRKNEGIPTVKSLFQSLTKTPPGGSATGASPSPSGTLSEGPKEKKRRIQTIKLDQPCLDPAPTSVLTSPAARSTANPQHMKSSPLSILNQPSVLQAKPPPTCTLNEPIVISDNSNDSAKENTSDPPLLVAMPTSANKTVQGAITPKALHECTNVQELEDVSVQATE